MASQTWNQKFLTNPISANQNDDLLYWARSPYSTGNDAVINWQNFSAQFMLATPIASHDLLANITGGSAVPVANTLTALMDVALGSARGGVLYRGASTWTVRAPGTSGQIFQTAGNSADPVWTSYTMPGTVNKGNILYGSANNVVSGLAALSASSTLVIDSSNVPHWVAMTANQILIGGATVPSATTLTLLMDAVFGNTQGDILYRSATGWTVLTPGTSGNVLTTQGAPANPIWSSVSSGLSLANGSGTPSLIGGDLVNVTATNTYSFAWGQSTTTSSGNNSIAFGYQTVASGDYSFALGYRSLASGNASFAMGQNHTNAEGDFSFAFGNTSLVSSGAAYGFAFGNGAVVNNTGSWVIGDSNTPEQDSAANQFNSTFANGYRFFVGSSLVGSIDPNFNILFGRSTSMSGTHNDAVVLGAGATGAGSNAVALGNNAFAQGASSIAISSNGSGCAAIGAGSIAIGGNANSSHSGSMALHDGSAASVTDALLNQFTSTFANGHQFYIGTTLSVNIDPAFNFIYAKGFADQSNSYQQPTTGFSITFGAGVTSITLDPSGTLASGTITMPASPIDGQIVKGSTTQTITSFTLAGNSGQSVANAPTTLVAGASFSYRFNLANSFWYVY